MKCEICKQELKTRTLPLCGRCYFKSDADTRMEYNRATDLTLKQKALSKMKRQIRRKEKQANV